MDEKKVFIEPDDEITDVVDKIEETDKDIVVLTIPKSATILQSIVNFKLIKKKADENDKRLVVVSGSDRGRKLAEQVGISVYSKAKADEIVKEEKKKQLSDDHKQRFPLDMTKKSPKKKSKNKGPEADISQEESSDDEKNKPVKGKKTNLPSWAKKLAWVGLGIVLLAGLVAAYLYLPKASASLKIETEEKKGKVEFALKESSDLSEGEVYGEMVTVESEAKDEFDATGHKQVGGRASGQITIYNYWSSETQPLVASTRFVHNPTGKLFRTTSRVEVPGTRIVEGEQVPGEATVTIRADQVGSDFNVSAARFTIPGLSSSKQEKIYGQSDSQMTGGYEKEILVVSEQDYKKAKKSLIEQLNKELESKLKEKVSDREVLAKKSHKILSESASPEVGQEAGTFEFTLKKRVTSFAYDKTELVNKLKDIFKKEISYSGEVIINKPDEQLEVKKANIDRENKKANLTVRVEAKLTPEIDREILKDNIVGRKKAEAEKYLIGYSQIKDARLDLWPFWVKSVPDKKERINFELQYE